MTKTILCCLSEWGYWGEELVGPYDVLIDHGYQVDFMTPTGQKPLALDPSMQAGYLDPPLDKVVTANTSRNAPARSKNRTCSTSRRTCRPGSRRCRISTAPGSATPWRTTTPSATPAGRSWTSTTHCCCRRQRPNGRHGQQRAPPRRHPGFSGQRQTHCRRMLLRDLPGLRPRLDRPQEHHRRKTRDRPRPRIRLQRRHRLPPPVVTANFGPPFYPWNTSCAMRSVRTAQYHGGVGHTLSTILDYPFLTGRSTQDSQLVGELMVQVLEKGLRRYGW